MLSNCSAGEDSSEFLGQQGDQTSQSQRKSTMTIHWKDWCWTSNILVTWKEEPTHWKRPWCWERLKVDKKGTIEDEMVGWLSLTQLTWVWTRSGRQWRTGKAGMLQSTGLWRVRHDCATEQPQKKPNLVFISNKIDPVIWPLQLILNSFLHQVGKKKYSFYFLNV